MAITTFTAVILLFSFHLFTAKDFKAPWTSRNIHKDPPKKTFQSKTNENVDAQIETLQQDMKQVMDMLQQTIQNKIERNRGDETTGTPEPEKLLSTVTEGNKPIAAQTTAAQTTAAATTAAATTATATTAATITKVLKAKKKGDGTNSDTKNVLTKIKDLLSKKLKLLKAVQKSFQNLPGKDETTETPHQTVTERTNSDIENASEKTIQRLISKELNELETNFVEKLKPTQPAMQTKSESFQKHPVEDETTKTPVPEKQPPIVTDEENINGNSPSETHPGIDPSAILKVALLIALAVILALFIVRHKRNQRSSRTFASSHYDSCSGTTTFTAANELGEDEKSPMIGRFSDEKLLVIA